jgi:hypothetical protein
MLNQEKKNPSATFFHPVGKLRQDNKWNDKSTN